MKQSWDLLGRKFNIDYKCSSNRKAIDCMAWASLDVLRVAV